MLKAGEMDLNIIAFRFVACKKVSPGSATITNRSPSQTQEETDKSKAQIEQT